MTERTAIYRLYDGDGTLLYVGITGNLSRRRGQHAASKHWWPDVVREEIRWHLRQEDAEAEEDRAILTEEPRYNVKRPPVMPDVPGVKAALDAHAVAMAEREETRAELHAAIVAALGAGIRQAELVRMTGYTRERIRQIARDARQAED